MGTRSWNYLSNGASVSNFVFVDGKGKNKHLRGGGSSLQSDESNHKKAT